MIEKNVELVHIGGRTSVPVYEIQYLKAMENYSVVYLKGGQQILVATTLKILEKRLPDECFKRIRRGVLVNRNFIKHIENYTVVLRNNLSFEIPRRKRDTFEMNIA